jgi:hypothetical protein
VAAIASTTSLVLAACSPAPAAPALSDPKEILVQTVTSLKDVKTLEFTGSLTGTLNSPELGGALDLSSTKLSGAVDIPGKKAKFNVDAPSLMGTKVDALLLDTAAYYKIDGVLSSMVGGTPGKYTKVDVPAEAGTAANDPAEIAKGIDELKKGLDQLPSPPTKGADEKCGDQDCYHVTLKMTAADVKKLNPMADAGEGDFTLDIWSRKSDVRPAKIAVTVTTPQTGTVGVTFEFKYDVSVSVDAPPADQVAP